MPSPQIAVGDYFWTSLRTESITHSCFQKFYWQCTVIIGTAPTYEQVIASMDDVQRPVVRPLMADVCQYSDSWIQRILPAPQTDIYSSANGTVFCTEESEQLPNQVCGMITKRTGFAGRSFRGRCYVPFPGEAFNENQRATPTAAYKTMLDDFASVFFEIRGYVIGAGSIQIEPQLYQPTLDNFVPIVDSVSRPYWTTQMRRQASQIRQR
jgi:hypothetical protein